MNQHLPEQVKAVPASSFKPVQGRLLQRKCACGNSSGLTAQCAECDEKRLRIQRRSDGQTEPSAVPPIVNEALRSPGQPLDTATRAFMESRFGHDFSRVRVHHDAQAAESVRAVNALAYTVGQHIVFGSGQYAPHSREGQKTLAHELTHTIQQERSPALQSGLQQLSPQQQTDGQSETRLAINRPGDLFEQEADRIAESILRPGQPLTSAVSRGPAVAGSIMLQRQTPGSQPDAAIRPRGTNPASCIEPLCEALAPQPTPADNAEAQKRLDDWQTQSLDCVRAGASGSNASYANDIALNEAEEIPGEAAQLKQILTGEPQNPDRLSRFQESLKSICNWKRREVEIEFRYNVVFENPPGGLRWGWGVAAYGDASWNEIERALEGTPAEATWLSPRLIRFSRSKCHPDDIQSGACGKPPGSGGKLTGGQTNILTGQIEVFESGLRSWQYPRSANLSLSATTQTIRHEIGHLVDPQIPLADQDDFFENIVHWHRWNWLSIRNPADPQMQAVRQRFSEEVGLDGKELDEWLDNLPFNTEVAHDTHLYFRNLDVSTPSGGVSYYLNAYDPSQRPQGMEFEYARQSKGEYFAELYALAISEPEFLHKTLHPAQLAWLKRVVFHTPADLKTLAQQTSLPETLQAEFVTRGSRLFTWEQLEALLGQLASQALPAGQQAEGQTKGQPGQTTAPQAAAATGQRPASLRDIFHAPIRERALEMLRRPDWAGFLGHLHSLGEVERHALEVDEPFMNEVRRNLRGNDLWNVRLILKFGGRQPDYVLQLSLAVAAKRYREIKRLLHQYQELREEIRTPGVREMLDYELRDVPARPDIMSDLSLNEEEFREARQAQLEMVPEIEEALLADLQRFDAPSFLNRLRALDGDQRYEIETDMIFQKKLSKHLRGRALWDVQMILRFGDERPLYVRQFGNAVMKKDCTEAEDLLNKYGELSDEAKVPGLRDMIAQVAEDDSDFKTPRCTPLRRRLRLQVPEQ